MAAIGPLPWSVLGLFAARRSRHPGCCATPASARISMRSAAMPTGARLAGIRTDRVTIRAHVLCSLFAGLTGLYLASRLRSGAPWIGRDGVYDLESIAVVVIGGTLLAGGRGGVWGTIAGVLLFAVIDASFNMLGRPGLPQAGDPRRHRDRGGGGLFGPHAGARGMTIALPETATTGSAARISRGTSTSGW